MTFFVFFGLRDAYLCATFSDRCLPNVCQVTKNTPSRCLESVFSCPGREHFYMFIINVLQNFQAKTQAILECHNIRMIALKKSAVTMLIFSGICKYFGDSAKNRPPFYRSSQAVLGRRRSKNLMRSYGHLAGFRAVSALCKNT